MSEFGGEDGPHGIDPRNAGAILPASDKLRLLYAVGTYDPSLPRDPAKHAWHGTNPARYEGLDVEDST